MKSSYAIRSAPTAIFMLVLQALLVLFTLGAWDVYKSPATAANGSVMYTYDALGRVSTASYDTGVIVIYAYDANGNRTSQTINVNTGTMCWNTVGTGCTTATWDTGLWH